MLPIALLRRTRLEELKKSAREAEEIPQLRHRIEVLEDELGALQQEHKLVRLHNGRNSG